MAECLTRAIEPPRRVFDPLTRRMPPLRTGRTTSAVRSLPLNVAIVGATGAVGNELLRVLDQRRFPVSELRLLASAKSTDRTLTFRGRAIPVQPLAAEAFRNIQIAFFSAGKSVSREFVPRAVQAGATVVDNSSAFRMDAGVPLCVPEVNGHLLAGGPRVVAVPNCTAIILCMAIWPIHRVSPVERIVVSTYQAVSGAGARALDELHEQLRAVARGEPPVARVLPHPIAMNVFSHNTPVGPTGFNEEETKVIDETRRILDVANLPICPTCIRVPVPRAHAESITLTLAQPLEPDRARALLAAAPGVRVVDDAAANHFPMPVEASDQDDVLVGRIRSDPSQPSGRGLCLFACGDQLRKGAASNAVQIAERLVGSVQ
ncbi:MAG: aspartate-semialdehyde dehydrogenase [Phycisphaerae bacterium]